MTRPEASFEAELSTVANEWKRREPRVIAALTWLTLAAMVTVSPWFFGGTASSMPLWLMASAIVGLVCGLVGLLRSRAAGTAWTAALIPLFSAVALGCIQLVELSPRLQRLVSPAAYDLRHELLGELPADGQTTAESTATERGVSRHPSSLYPASTRHDLAMLVLATSVFAICALWAAADRFSLWLFAAVALNGTMLSLFGIVQALTNNGRLYWSVPLADGGKPFASFVNRNNAGGFLNLCLAAAIGIAVCILHRGAVWDERWSFADRKVGWRNVPTRWSKRVERLMDALSLSSVAGIALVCVTAAGVLCTLSRGAAVSMCGAVLVTATAVAISRPKGLDWRWGAVAVIGSAALASWVGMGADVQTRLASLVDAEAVAKDGRLLHWRDTLMSAADYWRVGAGLGTYRYAYQPYQTHASSGWFYHAENQYFEALVEGGIPGLALLLLAIALVGRSCWRLLHGADGPISYATGVVGVFALSSQGIHAFFDFGLYLPANMTLLAAISGLVCGRVSYVRPPTRRTTLTVITRGRLGNITVLTALLAGAALGCYELFRVAGMERKSVASDAMIATRETNDRRLRDAVIGLEHLLRRRPDDAEAHYRLAMLHVQRYRAAAFQKLRRETNSDDTELLWKVTSPALLHYRAHLLQHEHDVSGLESLRRETAIVRHLEPAHDHFRRARRACPLLPRVHLYLAELSFVAGSPCDDKVHLNRLRHLAPGDPELLYECGLLEYHAERFGMAFADWKNALRLSTSQLDEIVRLSRSKLSTPQLVDRVMPADPAVLVELARRHYGTENHKDERLWIATRALRLLEQARFTDYQRYYLRGAIYALQSRHSEAIADYKRALVWQPHNIKWRYELAQLLSRAGRRREAHRQARICLDQAPRNRRYQELVATLESS